MTVLEICARSRWHRLAFFALPAMYLSVGVLHTHVGNTPMAVLHLLAAPMWLLIGYGQVRKRVGLDDDGIRIVQGYTRRRILWTDVASLKVDPPGGARIPRLTLTTGIDVPLPELTPAAREMLEQAYVSRPGIDGGSQPTEDESHGSTTEVPR